MLKPPEVKKTGHRQSPLRTIAAANDSLRWFVWILPVAICQLLIARLRCLIVGALGRLNQRDEPRGVIGGDISQDLAVEFDSGFLQAANELVIAEALCSCGRADTYDPYGAILALLLLASSVGELE